MGDVSTLVVARGALSGQVADAVRTDPTAIRRSRDAGELEQHRLDALWRVDRASARHLLLGAQLGGGPPCSALPRRQAELPAKSIESRVSSELFEQRLHDFGSEGPVVVSP